MPKSKDPKTNRLLAALPDTEFRTLLPHLESIKMPLGDVLYESGKPICYVYFPTSAIVSILYELKDGASAEIAIVGNEGIVGVSLFMGGCRLPAVQWCRVQAWAIGSRPSFLKPSLIVRCR